jgi:hypothetical protein
LPRPLRHALVALSLANLCFLAPWLVLLNPQHYMYYHWPAHPEYVEFQALALAILTLALLFWLGATVVDRSGSRRAAAVARAAFLVTLILPINSFIIDYLRVSVLALLLSRWWTLLLGICLAVAIVWITYRYNRQLTRVASTLLIILSPLFLVNLASALWLREKYGSPAETFHEQRPATSTHKANAPRIIWIVFDELDQRLLFTGRPGHISFPEFDRFRSQALHSANAYPPNHATLISMPALITGHLITQGAPVGSNKLMLTLPDGAVVDWATQSNVFSEARSEGFSTGVAGWYHPYCRVIGASFDWCASVPMVHQLNPILDDLSLRRALRLCTQTAVFRIPLAYRLLKSRYQAEKSYIYQQELVRVSRLSQTLLQRDLNLTMLHFPVPHDSRISGKSYVDNLALADQALGELRHALEERSRWDSSIVLLTSDHWWRGADIVNGKRDHRIPFMLKLAGQKAEMEYDKPFNTVLTRNLLLELLRGNLASPADVAAWIDTNSKLAESPFTAVEP